MRDQALHTGFAATIISAIERGDMEIPVGYLESVIDWLELPKEEVDELKLAATLKPSRKAMTAKAADRTLPELLNTLSIETTLKREAGNG